MRLTLRTLLSYRDGVLTPQDQQELGQKLRASATAQGISKRIDGARSALRLPQYATEPALHCSANDVAEFLDDAMQADRLFEIERVCLREDSLLSEVASVHTILAKELLPSGSSDSLVRIPSQELMTRLYSLHSSEDRFRQASQSSDKRLAGSVGEAREEGRVAIGGLSGAISKEGIGSELDDPLDLESSIGGGDGAVRRRRVELVMLCIAFVFSISMALSEFYADTGRTSESSAVPSGEAQNANL
jgi:hypothetical protein